MTTFILGGCRSLHGSTGVGLLLLLGPPSSRGNGIISRETSTVLVPLLPEYWKLYAAVRSQFELLWCIALYRAFVGELPFRSAQHKMVPMLLSQLHTNANDDRTLARHVKVR
jgi:hypothetical protein